MIYNCVSTDSGKTIEWEINSRKIVKKYDYQVYFEIGGAGDYIVAVEPDNEFSPNNAVIFNPDGTERKRIINPLSNDGAICFGDVYCERGSIVLVSVCPRANYICVLDHDGGIESFHETR